MLVSIECFSYVFLGNVSVEARGCIYELSVIIGTTQHALLLTRKSQLTMICRSYCQTEPKIRNDYGKKE